MSYTNKQFAASVSFSGDVDGWLIKVAGSCDLTVTSLADGSVSGTWAFSGSSTITLLDDNGAVLLDDLGNVFYSETTDRAFLDGVISGTLTSTTFTGSSDEFDVTATGSLLNDVVSASLAITVDGYDVSTTLAGAANIEYTGTDGADSTTGAAGADVLDGGLGNDVMDGGAGDDVLDGGVGDDQLDGGEGDDQLDGGEGNDILDGGEGDNVLDGGTGTDTVLLEGSKSDYSIYVKKAATTSKTFLTFTGLQAGDVVVLTHKDGQVNQIIDIEKVQFSEDSSTVDVSKTALLSGAGTYGDDKLTGDTSDNTIHAAAGKDVVNGGVGADQLYGEEGIDQLSGGDGNDKLYGGADSDKLAGGKGDDTYYIEDIDSKGKTDTITEKAGEGTADKVFSSVSSYTLAKEVENLTLNGTGNYSGTGNTSANTITGNSGRNTVNGKEGNDTLEGGEGIDKFVFDTKLDGTKNVDTITDFTSDEDVIQLSKKIFSAYKTTGALGDDDNDDFITFDSSADETAADAAFDTTVHFVYDIATGDLYYDKDGSGKNGDGGTAPVKFATLTGQPDLSESDLYIV